jgi:hypothetical protein
MRTDLRRRRKIPGRGGESIREEREKVSEKNEEK